ERREGGGRAAKRRKEGKKIRYVVQVVAVRRRDDEDLLPISGRKRLQKLGNAANEVLPVPRPVGAPLASSGAHVAYIGVCIGGVQRNADEVEMVNELSGHLAAQARAVGCNAKFDPWIKFITPTQKLPEFWIRQCLSNPAGQSKIFCAAERPPKHLQLVQVCVTAVVTSSPHLRFPPAKHAIEIAVIGELE